MRTEIIIKDGWQKIDCYDFLFTMTKGDVVEWNGREYKVDCCVLEVDTKKMLILVDL